MAKKVFSGAIPALFFFSMLCCPGIVFEGAQDGLLLWFQIVFPTLFPFMMISSILISSQGFNFICSLAGPLVSRIFSVSKNGSFVILCGFLCGYPMGAKTTADLIHSRKISTAEGRYLLSFCNNTSPAFIINYIAWKIFERKELIFPSLLILMSVPVMLSFIFRKIYCVNKDLKASEIKEELYMSKFGNERDDFDSCMMHSLEAIVKVGGYIIVFSVLIKVLQYYFSESYPVTVMLSFLEMTNGIILLKENIPDPALCYASVIGLTAFGGFCSIAQTKCMIADTGISIIPYLTEKLAAAAAASLLAYFYILLFQKPPSLLP